MLLSLLKILFFFSVVLAAALGAMYLAEHGQPLVLQFNGVEYTLGPVQVLVLAAVVVLASWLVAVSLIPMLSARLKTPGRAVPVIIRRSPAKSKADSAASGSHGSWKNIA